MHKIHQKVYWYQVPHSHCKPLQEHTSADVVIVGGGIAGLSAAQAAAQRGKSVIILEKEFCGAGASGKSSGFITPDSELELNNFIHLFNKTAGKQLWELGLSGVDFIRTNIETHRIDCDFQKQDSLYLASSASDFKSVQEEYDARMSFDYSTVLYDKTSIKKIVNSDGYYGGISYNNTFGMNSFAYCQAMKEILTKKFNVKIYEQTPVKSVEKYRVITDKKFTVACGNSIITADYQCAQLNFLKQDVYHAQTFLLLSKPLTSAQVQQIFPEKYFMSWDSELIFNYFRLIGDNRLLLGGGTLWSTYAYVAYKCPKKIIKKLTDYFKKKFPSVDIEFEYVWPGLIGTSKDFVPVAGYDKRKPYSYCITAAAGLPWATALGNYAIQHIFEQRTDLDQYFSPQRHFSIGGCAQKILGDRITFALANGIAKFLT